MKNKISRKELRKMKKNAKMTGMPKFARKKKFLRLSERERLEFLCNKYAPSKGWGKEFIKKWFRFENENLQAD